jgi:hypothetical protein
MNPKGYSQSQKLTVKANSQRQQSKPKVKAHTSRERGAAITGEIAVIAAPLAS